MFTVSEAATLIKFSCETLAGAELVTLSNGQQAAPDAPVVTKLPDNDDELITFEYARGQLESEVVWSSDRTQSR